MVPKHHPHSFTPQSRLQCSSPALQDPGTPVRASGVVHLRSIGGGVGTRKGELYKVWVTGSWESALNGLLERARGPAWKVTSIHQTTNRTPYPINPTTPVLYPICSHRACPQPSRGVGNSQNHVTG
eukprot:749737-Hanusia_phi.AAC.1